MTYISGKITGLDIDLAKSNFASARIRLLPEITINPMEVEPMFGISTWWCHMFADLWELIRCDSIFVMSNWKESRGARIELFVAKMLSKNIYYDQS